MSQHLQILHEDDDDPMLSAVNLVDVFLVLVVALLTAVALQRHDAAPAASPVQQAGQPGMELVVREHGQDVRYQGVGSAAQGEGVRAGIAYRLKDGNIVYIPEPGEAPAPAK